jgi:hypothetical protein
MMKGLNMFPFADLLLKEVKSAGQELTEICDRPGSFAVSNYSFAKSPMTAKFPAGDYRLNIKFFDDIDENIGNFTMIGTVSK